MTLVGLLLCKSIPSPKVDPATTPARNRALRSTATASRDSCGSFPPPSTSGRKKTHRIWFVHREFIPLKVPTSVPEPLETRLPHSMRRARDPHAARCLLVICFNCYFNLTPFTMKQLMPRWILRGAQESQNAFLPQRVCYCPICYAELSAQQPWDPTRTVLLNDSLEKCFNECCYPKACGRRRKD